MCWMLHYRHMYYPQEVRSTWAPNEWACQWDVLTAPLPTRVWGSERMGMSMGCARLRPCPLGFGLDCDSSENAALKNGICMYIYRIYHLTRSTFFFLTLKLHTHSSTLLGVRMFLKDTKGKSHKNRISTLKKITLFFQNGGVSPWSVRFDLKPWSSSVPGRLTPGRRTVQMW